MTLTLDLPPELEQRLAEEAARQGVPAETYTLELLAKHLAPDNRRTELVSLLDSWLDQGDAAEQRETGEYLVRVLDEDRLSDRRLFPPELEGVTW